MDQLAVKTFLKQITEVCPLDEFLISLVKDYTITALTKNAYYKK